MPEGGVELVRELVTRTAAPGAFRTSALDHEIRNHAMEYEAVIEALSSLGSFGQADEVFDGLRRLVGEQLQLEVSFGRVEQSERFVGHGCDCSKPAGRFQPWS